MDLNLTEQIWCNCFYKFLCKSLMYGRYRIGKICLSLLLYDFSTNCLHWDAVFESKYYSSFLCNLIVIRHYRLSFHNYEQSCFTEYIPTLICNTELWVHFSVSPASDGQMFGKTKFGQWLLASHRLFTSGWYTWLSVIPLLFVMKLLTLAPTNSIFVDTDN